MQLRAQADREDELQSLRHELKLQGRFAVLAGAISLMVRPCGFEPGRSGDVDDAEAAVAHRASGPLGSSR